MMSIETSLAGKTALVTGGSSGLGPHIVKLLDKAGASVAIHYRDQADAAAELSQALRNQSTVLQADLTDTTQINSLFKQARDALGDISILVNCAAVASQSVTALSALEAEEWQRTMTANTTAPMLLTQALAAQGIGGTVINISSIEGSRPAPGHAHYATSKAALEMLTKAAALEYGPGGVRVNAVAPGLIDRPGIESGWPEGVERWRSAAPLGRLVDPGDIAAAVVYLASPQASCISGQVLTVDCGLSAQPAW